MTTKKEQKTRVPIKSEYLKELKKLCKDHDVTLDGLFHRLVLYPELTRQLLSFPDEISMEMWIDSGTVTKLLPLWMANLRDNFVAVKEGKDIKEMPEVKNMPALVIGAGPSLLRRKHLELLAEEGFKGHIFATDATLKSCLELGIMPDYVLFLDASEKIFKFIDHEIVDEYADKLTAIMNIVTHPSVVKRWKGDIYWYQTYIEELFAPNICHVIQLLTKTTALASGGQCASLAWVAAVLKGYNPIVLIGVDLSYPADIPVEKTKAYDFYLSEVFHGDKEKTLKIFNNHYHHNFFNTDCYYELLFGSYTEIAKGQFISAKEKGIKIINCSEGGTLEGEGIECMWFKDYLDAQKR